MYVILQGVTELALHSPGAVPAAAGVADPEGVETPLAWGRAASFQEVANLYTCRNI